MDSNQDISSCVKTDRVLAKSARQLRERIWLTGIQAGDERAFESLYRSYYKPLILFVLPFVKSSSIAEEVVEDVFVHLWEHRAELNVRCSTNTYLFAAAKNRALNVARHMRVEQLWRTKQAVNLSGEQRDNVAIQIDDATFDMERVRSAVRAAIDSLPEQRRRVLQLRWQQEMSYSEIAEVLGSSVVAVERQLSRTLKALRLALPEWLTGEDRPRP